MMTPRRREEIRQLFGFHASGIDRFDIQTGQLWDSIKLEAGQEFRDGLTMFQRGSEGGCRGADETNVYQPCRLDAPEHFAVQRVAVQRVLFTFSRFTSDRDCYEVAESTAFRFWLGSKH